MLFKGMDFPPPLCKFPGVVPVGTMAHRNAALINAACWRVAIPRTHGGTSRKAVRQFRDSTAKVLQDKLAMQQKAILPGATIASWEASSSPNGFASAARRMGYRVHTFSPYFDTPPGHFRTWK